jgi:prophage antirepressor-like protein
MKELVKEFNGRGVRMVIRNHVEWFVAKDVCDVLEIANVSDAVSDFPESERSNIASSDIRKLGMESGNRGLLAINEPGLYRLIFKSRKPQAESFKTWVFEEVLPSIRKTGKYDVKDIRETSVEKRKRLTDEWQRQGVKTGKQYGSLTKEEYERLFGDRDLKKEGMDREQVAKLAVFEDVERWKLDGYPEAALGYAGCKESIDETAALLSAVRALQQQKMKQLGLRRA